MGQAVQRQGLLLIMLTLVQLFCCHQCLMSQLSFKKKMLLAAPQLLGLSQKHLQRQLNQLHRLSLLEQKPIFSLITSSEIWVRSVVETKQCLLLVNLIAVSVKRMAGIQHQHH